MHATQEAAVDTLKCLDTIYKGLSKKKQMEYIGELNEACLFLEACKFALPSETETIQDEEEDEDDTEDEANIEDEADIEDDE